MNIKYISLQSPTFQNYIKKYLDQIILFYEIPGRYDHRSLKKKKKSTSKSPQLLEKF